MPDSTTASYLLAKRLHRNLPFADEVEIIHPDDVDRRVTRDDKLIIFTDAVHTANRVRIRKKELNIKGCVVLTFACLDLRPEDDDLYNMEILEPFSSVVRWPFDRPVTTEPTESCTIYRVDAFTNIRIVKENGGREGLYDSLVWKCPDQTQLTDEVKKQFHITADDISPFISHIEAFTYGIQLVDGRAHVARCRVSKLIENSDFFSLVARWIAAILISLEPSDGQDIIIFMRDESTLQPFRVRLTEKVLNYLLDDNSGWDGRMYTSTIPAIRSGHRQFLIHDPKTALAEAKEVIFRTESKQLALSLENGKLEPGQESIKGGFIALMVDNASVSGRTMRDFALAMTESGTRSRPSSIVICPILSRLSPSEELFLVRTPVLRSRAGEAVTECAFRFEALMQLRIESHLSFDAMPGVSRLRELLAGLEDVHQPPLLCDWVRGIMTKLRKLVLGIEGVEQFPLHPSINLTPCRVSENVLLIRHLLAIYHQGVPVVEAMIHSLRTAFRDRDFSLIMMLALEAELIQDVVLSGSFSGDIEELCILALDHENAGMRSNALWVLYCQRDSFIGRQTSISERCIFDEELRGQWLAFLHACPTDERALLVFDILEKIDRLSNRPDSLEDNSRSRALREVSTSIHQWQGDYVASIPKDLSEARHAIYRLLREARSRHGDRGFAAWREIVSKSIKREDPAMFEEVPADELWQEAEVFLNRFLLPAMESLALIAGAQLRGGLEELERVKMTLLKGFQSSIDAAKRDNMEDLIESWEQVNVNSLSSSIGHLYCKEVDCILGTVQTLEDVGYLNGVLPDIVQEPAGLLLWHLDRKMHSFQGLTIVGDFSDGAQIGPVESVSGSLRSPAIEQWLTMNWKYSKRIPLFWGKINVLRELMSLIADNVQRHSDFRYPCSVTYRLKDGSDGSSLVIRISDVPRDPRRPGEGNGVGQIRHLAGRLSCAISFAHVERDYVVDMSIPVSTLENLMYGD